MGSNAFNLANVALTASPSSNATVTYFSGNLQAQSIEVQGAFAPGNGLYEPTNNALGFTTGGSERVRINSSGQVGINTTNPTTVLQVNTSAQGTDGILVIGPNTSAQNGNMTLRPNNSQGANNGITQAGDSGIIYSSNANVNTGNLVIAPWNNIAASGIRMNASGNVMFNTATVPSGGNVTLVVNGFSTNAGGVQMAGGTAGGGNVYGINGGGLVFGSYTGAVGSETYTERMRIDAGGNVGIGLTSSLTNSLNIPATNGKGIAFGASTGNYANIWNEYSGADLLLATNLYGSSTSQSILSAFTGTVGSAAIRVAYAGTLQFYTDAASAVTRGNTFTPTERLRIDTAGNIIFSTTGAQIGSAKVSILSGTTNATQYTTIAATGGSTMSILQQQTTSVSTIATIILATPQYATLALVHGSDGTNRFSDLVLMSVGTGTVNVISSLSAAGTPAARTYSQTASTFRLAMASGTYTVQVASLGLNS